MKQFAVLWTSAAVADAAALPRRGRRANAAVALPKFESSFWCLLGPTIALVTAQSPQSPKMAKHLVQWTSKSIGRKCSHGLSFVDAFSGGLIDRGVCLKTRFHQNPMK